MLKTLTMFRMQNKKQGEGVILVVFYAPETPRDIKIHYMWPYECVKSGLMYRRGYDLKNCGKTDEQGVM